MRSGPIRGLDLGGEAVQIRDRREIRQDLDTAQFLGLQGCLFGGRDYPDGNILQRELPVANHYRSVLGLIEVELKDDPVGLCELVTATSSPKRTQRGLVGTVA